MGETLPPLRVREPDGSPNVIPVYDMIMSSNLTVQNRGGGVIAISATTGAGAGTVYAATGNDYVVMNLAADLTAEHRLVQSGNSITISTAAGLVTINAVTNAAAQGIVQSGALGALAFYPSLGATVSGSLITTATGTSIAPFNVDILTGNAASATSGDIWVVFTNNALFWQGQSTSTIYTMRTPSQESFPMALLTVEVNSGNAFWTAQTDTTRMDKAYVNMVDSGRSVSTWWTYVPRSLNANPRWGIDVVSEAAAGGSAGGFIVLNVDGMSTAIGESANTLAASTVNLVAAGSFRLNTAGILSISTMTGTNFDASLATSATDYMKVKLTRQGNADTLNSDWYIYSVLLKAYIDK